MKPNKYLIYKRETDLKISFWVMIAMTIILPIIDANNEDMFLAFGYLAIIVYTFVVSIYCVKYSEKQRFSIIALVLSSINLLLFLIGVIIGVIQITIAQ